ncbi:MAG: GTPase RsgA, partial [Frankiaceae bacterium]|nr:GTPase RsgA [Frankiaceae bacterium]
MDRSAYDVLSEDGPRRLPALPPPVEVTVGDWLAIGDEAVVAVLPRTSLLVRGVPSGRSRTQPLAANVDVVLVVASLAGAIPVRRVERLLTLAWESGATPVVVLTKADLHPDPEASPRPRAARAGRRRRRRARRGRRRRRAGGVQHT